MNKKFIQVVYLIAALSLSLAACNSGNMGELNQITTEMVSADLTTETPIPTEISPTETPLPPTDTPVSTETLIPALVPGDSIHFVDVGGIKRKYLLYIPPGLTEMEAVPIVFVLHGLGRDPWQMQRTSGLDETADTNGFMVVYPEGMEGSWNSGEKGPGYAIRMGIDESAFFEAILSDLNIFINVDPKRIYATGKSLGGMMSYRLACDMSDIFAAVASVAGPMYYSSCLPTRAVSVMHIHGDDDYLVPFEGIEGNGSSVPPVQDGIGYWATFNSCNESTVVNNYDSGFTHTTYSFCEDGTVVELILVDGMDHIWPDFASQTIWDFFTEHPMP